MTPAEHRAEVERLAWDFGQARARKNIAKDNLRAAVIAAYGEEGCSESELARLAGVNRLTVRAWLGKS